MGRRPNSTTKLGRTLEDDIAKWYDGKRSRSSGAARGDKGDVRFSIFVEDWVRGPSSHEYLAECKTTEAKSVSIKREVWDKIEEEAKQVGKRPTLFLRFYDHDTGKHKDLVVRDVNDDLEMLG